MRVTSEMLKDAGWEEFLHRRTGIQFWRSPSDGKLYLIEDAIAIYEKENGL